MAEQYNVMQSLFGFTPQNVQRQLYQQADERAKQLAGTGQGSVAAYYALSGLERSGTRPLFGQNPQVQQAADLQSIIQQVQTSGADLSTPEGMVALAQELGKNPQFIGMATAIRQEAAKSSLEAQKAGAEMFQRTAAGYASLAQAAREKTPAALEQADRLRLEELQRQFGNVEGARRFREERDEAGRRQAAAGVPAPGEVGIPTIKGAQDIVSEYTKGSKEKLDQIMPLRTTLAEARNNKSGAAFEQLRGQLIKLVGDSQISNAERARITGSSGIVADAINKVNMLLTGTPTDDKFKELDRIVASLEKAYSDKYNAGINKADTVLGQAKLAPETRAALLPNRYVSGLDRQAQQTPATIDNQQVFRDAKGNTAIFKDNKWVEVKLVNGKWTPVQ